MFSSIYEKNQLKPCNNIDYSGKSSKYINRPTLYLVSKDEK